MTCINVIFELLTQSHQQLLGGSCIHPYSDCWLLHNLCCANILFVHKNVKDVKDVLLDIKSASAC